MDFSPKTATRIEATDERELRDVECELCSESFFGMIGEMAEEGWNWTVVQVGEETETVGICPEHEKERLEGVVDKRIRVLIEDHKIARIETTLEQLDEDQTFLREGLEKRLNQLRGRE